METSGSLKMSLSSMSEEDRLEFKTISDLLVNFVLQVEGPECSTPGEPSYRDENGLICPLTNGLPVQKDGPGNRKGPRVPPVMSLSTLDGGLYVFNHGKMVQEGKFEYHHLTSTLTSVLAINETTVYLAPDFPDADANAVLIKQHDMRHKEGEAAQLTGVHSRKTLALSYTDDPNDAKFELLPEHELKDILEKIARKETMVPMITPTIHIQKGTDGHDSHNIALYFVTPKFYYWIHVDSSNPPMLTKVHVNNTPNYDPAKNFIPHLQFIRRPPSVVRSYDTIDGEGEKGGENVDTTDSKVEGGDENVDILTPSFEKLSLGGDEKKEELTNATTPTNSADSKPNNVEQTPEKISEDSDKMPNCSTHIENGENHDSTPSSKENQALNGSMEISAKN